MKALLKKIGRVVLKILIGLVVFVFFVIYIVIPLGVPWAIRWQGSKILAHPVKVRSVWFNPFLLRVSVDGLKILSADKSEVLAGFDKFWVDASFLSVFKKEYRVETIGLKGLAVNVALLPGNKINLVELVPAASLPASDTQKPVVSAPQVPSVSAGSSPVAPPSLPNARIDTITVTDGVVTFTDKTLAPEFSTKLEALTLTVTGISTETGSIAHAEFSAKIDEKGLITAEANFKPLAQPVELESTFSLNDYALTILHPYVGKYTGRGVKTGKMELMMDYKIANNQLFARHKLLIQKFDFGEKVESKDALNLPFGLAIALLEDPQGRISISLPVRGDMSKPDFEFWPLVGQVVSNFFMKLVTSPFTALMSMAGAESGTEEMGTVSFDPGKSELTDKAKKKLALFTNVIKERPKLYLEVNGSYDPVEDWKAIKTEVYTADYNDRRSQTKRSDFRIIKDMYILTFGIRDFWELLKKFTVDKKIDEAAMNEEMRRLIIQQGREDTAMLELLARQRAKVVYDFMIAGGFDPARAAIGMVHKTQASMGLVPLEFTITVFEKEPS